MKKFIPIFIAILLWTFIVGFVVHEKFPKIEKKPEPYIVYKKVPLRIEMPGDTIKTKETKTIVDSAKIKELEAEKARADSMIQALLDSAKITKISLDDSTKFETGDIIKTSAVFWPVENRGIYYTFYPHPTFIGPEEDKRINPWFSLYPGIGATMIGNHKLLFDVGLGLRIKDYSFAGYHGFPLNGESSTNSIYMSKYFDIYPFSLNPLDLFK